MVALGLLSLVCWLWSAALADDQACLECHADPDLKRETAYKKGSPVFVDQALICDLGLVLRQNLGGKGASPRFGRFDFRQKFQYWAVALGVTAMVPTGLVLWFENQAMAALPKWVMDLARVVHSGEGLVIFLVLFLWHLYDTHLRPEVFPMDRTWLRGRMTRKQWRERHAREYEEAAGREEETS